MESSDEPSSDTDVDRSRDLPRDGKVQRILSQLQGLLEDLRTWIDLRLDLAILKVEERIDELQNNVALGLTLAVFGFFAALFSLTTIALGVGWLLGHPFWGFLAVSVALVLVVVGLRVAQPALVPPSNLLESLRGDRASVSGDGAPPSESEHDERAPDSEESSSVASTS